MSSYDVYLAAPLFTEAEREFNAALAGRLEGLGLRVFLPQRDGHEFSRFDGIRPEERVRRIFDLDVARVEECAILVAVLDGAVPDEGVCVELGIAHEQRRIKGERKLILGLRSDVRSWQASSPLNPMVLGVLNALASSPDALVEHLIQRRGIAPMSGR